MTMIAVACSAGLVTIGVLAGLVVSERSRMVLPVSTPVIVEPPKVPAPVVTVNVPPPPEPPAPPPPPPPPPAPRPRALAPHLDAACIVPLPEGATPLAACEWDDGFPAISADGALLAQKVVGGNSSPEQDISIAFTDVKTWKAVRKEILISAADLDREGKPRKGIEARIGRRVTAAQRALDEGGFRTLVWLGMDEPGAEPSRDPRIHAQLDDGAMQIVDPARSVVLWRHRFVPSIKALPLDETTMCGGLSLHHIMAWWEPPTGTVLAELSYTTGGCMCPHPHEVQLHRIPAAALALAGR